MQRAVTLLREQQWIDIFKVGTANVYRVNSGVFWTARADGRWASLRHIPLVQAEQHADALVTSTALGSDDPPEQARSTFTRAGTTLRENATAARRADGHFQPNDSSLLTLRRNPS